MLTSKIKKAILKPISFIKDSYFFKFHLAEDHRTTDNLFFISQMGQLAQYEELIRQRKLKNNVLIVLYTKKNNKMPRDISNKASTDLFNTIRLLCLPKAPMNINIKNYILMYNSYSYLLKRVKPKYIFISSFEKHYSLLANIAKSLNILVNLVEEGTGTYKYNNMAEANMELRRNLSKKEKIETIKIKLLPHYSELKNSLEIFNKFSNIYVSYPNLASEMFDCKNIYKFSAYQNTKISPEAISFCKAKKINKNDILFLAQRYPFPEEEYISSLLETVKKFSKNKKRVFIKLHPKERDSTKFIYLKLAKKLKNIFIIHDVSFSSEEVISFIKPNFVLSLTSTGLVYSNLISEKTKNISIYPTFKKSIIKRIGFNEDNFREIEQHYQILRKFSHIEHY